ncbi:MAG: zf-HC2 domain-containing protein [Gemmatimonadaceae bacterium]
MTQHPEEGTLHAYIDGELSPAETVALEQHVGECALCAAALAEARGFVAAASRVITTLDAAPSSAAKPAAPVAGVAAIPLKRVVRPPIFRVPYARAAALLLLVGGTAFVVDRTGTFARGKSTQTESLVADTATGSDLAATAAAEAANTTAAAPIPAPEAAAAVADLSSETDLAAITQRGVAGGVVAKSAAPMIAQTSVLAGKEAAPEAARPTALLAAPPPPARADVRLEEPAAASALSFGPTVVRYRTRDGTIVTLTEEPLRTSFAEESAATRQSAPAPARRRMAAPMAATPINLYRWSSAERGKTYTLSGPLTVAELEALSKRLNELERLP